MTRRERLERKLQKREEWAEKAQAKADSGFEAVRRIADGIPFGQPILVGHHSERHARRDAERIHNGMERSVERQKMAQHHRGAAIGIQHQLENSIFSDDPDAVEVLEAKVAKAEEKQALMKKVNAAIRRLPKIGPEAVLAALENLGISAALGTAMMKPDELGRTGFADYEVKNNAANIRRMKQRIEEVKARQERTAKAEAAGVLIEGGDYVRVTFPEAPGREICDALHAANFLFRGGSWCGKREALPAVVTEIFNKEKSE